MTSFSKWFVILSMLAGARAASADGLATLPAAARVHRSVGVGASRTMAGQTGFEIVYWPDRLGLTATVTAYRAEIEDATGISQTATAGTLALSGFMTLAGSEHARLALGLQLGVGRMFASGGPAQTSYQAGVPLRCEVFLTDQLALHADVGFSMMSEHAEGWPTTTVLESSGSVLGTGGFTYYF